MIKTAAHLCLFTIFLLNFSIISTVYAIADCGTFEEKQMVQVRIIDPIDVKDTNDLKWTGTFCMTKCLSTDEKGNSTITPDQECKGQDKQVQDCRTCDVDYDEKDSSCKPDDPTTPDNDAGTITIPEPPGKFQLVGKCKLIQIIQAESAAGLLKIFIGKLYKWGVSIGGTAAVLVIIVSGIEYITAGGDSNKTSTAKTRILQALSALVVLLLSGLILYTINPTFFVQ